ncbi:MAG TPA: amidohydrolase [Actinomycetes bacterium]
MTTTLYRHGRVRTPVDGGATALVTRGEQVAWVGRDDAAEADPSGVDEVVELDGALVTPAFVDAHVHATSTGLTVTGLDLTGTRSLAECLAAVEAHARRTRGGVVLGHGWDETTWPEHRPPTRQELDRASYGAVVYLSRVDVHSAVVSSALLAVAPEARAATGFSDSGHLTTEAHHVVRRVARESVTPAQRRAAQRATLERAARLGIGAFHELGGPDISSAEDFESLLALATGEPGPEVVGYWGELGAVSRARSMGALGAAGDLFADGAIGSHTACLRAPYADLDSTGHAYLTAAQVRDHVVACTEAGLQAGFHAIGDGALDAVVAGLREAAERVGAEALRTARHRLEHVEMVDAPMVATLADLGVVASVQPAFDALWGGADGMYAERLGARRALGLNPFADLAAAGVVLAFGSDAPVTPLDPWGTVRAAAGHHVPGQRLAVEAAFTAHTRGGWQAARRDDAGKLVPGAPATLAVWEAPGGLDAGTGLPALGEDLPLPRCRRTVVRGRTVFTP